MVKCSQSPHDFIRNAFTPQIGVLCSMQAEIACKKNNLSFIEMLHPFCKLGTEIHFRDGTGTSTPIRNFRVNLVDVNFRPPHAVVAKQYLHTAVRNFGDYARMQPIRAGEYSLQRVPYMVPWYDAWRETFLQVQYPTDHEFTKHFLACILVVSSADQNPLGVLNTLVSNLNLMQNGGNTQTKLPKWFNKNVLRYYVILHETASGIEDVKLVEMYDSLKAAYDSTHCFLLRINSRAPPLNDDEEQQPPDPWAHFLNHRIPSTPGGGVSPHQQHAPFSSKAATVINLDSAEEVQETGVAENVLYHPLSPDNSDSHTHNNIGAEFEASTTNSAGVAMNSTVLHGSCLSTEDVEQLKLFVHEFCTQALLPFLERQTHQLHELVVIKKGVSKSLLTATKRWFSPNKPNAATINTVTYTIDSPEISVRKLGDLYFMVGIYSLAYQAYHTAKRDFNTDQAWLYYAAALEMAALAAFMANEPTKKTFDYMEESINTYLNTCKLPQFATRATILSVECLKSRQLHGQAAHQLNRMTSEESDLRSALLLEQAAYCFLDGATGASTADSSSNTCLVRKYAFHMVLAGHRYSKATQRRHSLRCYMQAQEMYRARGWHFAEDHIHYTIGRQANGTGRLDEALESYSMLLTGQSRQSPQQQQTFLTDYLNIYNTFLEKNDGTKVPVLPLPLIDKESVKVLLGPATPVRSAGKVSALGVTFAEEDATARLKWNKLEEMIVQEAQGSLPLTFRPFVTLFTNDNISNIHPTAVLGEPIKVAVKLHNPLQILLHLTDVYLVWSFTSSNDVTITNEINGDKDEHQQQHASTMKTHVVLSIALQANASQELVLHVTPLSTGQLRLRGICYSILSMANISTSDSSSKIDAVAQVTSSTVRGVRLFDLQGPKVKKKEYMTPDWRADRRLTINVVPTAPCLQVSFGELASSDLLRNETQRIPVEMRNIGSIPIQRVFLATSVPQLLSSCDMPLGRHDKRRYQSVDLSTVMDAPALREREARTNHVIGPLPLDDSGVDQTDAGSTAGVLLPGHSRNITLWLRAPDIIGPTVVDLFVYYESVDAQVVPRYRIVRHIWHLVIQDSISLLATIKSSSNSTEVEQMTIRVNATNMNMVHHAVSTEISLLSISLLAKNWVLSQQVVSTNARKLLAQESVHFLLKATRDFRPDNKFSEVCFERDEAVSQLDKPFLDFAKREDCHKINIFEDIAKLQERLEYKSEGRIVLKWKAFLADSCGTRRTVFGQTSKSLDMMNLPPHISLTPFVDIPLDASSFVDCPVTSRGSNIGVAAFGVLLGLDGAVPIETDITQQRDLDIAKRQLNYNLVHLSEVQHDFQRSRICIVPVELYVHNATQLHLTMTIHTSGTSNSNDQPVEQSSLCIPCASSEHYRWTRSGCVVRSIGPLGNTLVRMSVAVLAAGTYDLGARLQVWALEETKVAPVLQSGRMYSALIVQNSVPL